MKSKPCWTRMKMQAIMKKRKTRRVVKVPLMEGRTEAVKKNRRSLNNTIGRMMNTRWKARSITGNEVR
jgi:hypothetical protein